jgi:hypothetical protein
VSHDERAGLPTAPTVYDAPNGWQSASGDGAGSGSLPRPGPPLLLELAVALGLTFADQTWRERAECRGQTTEWWYPSQGAQVSDQKAVCARCNAREECLQHALDHEERFGIWGGVGERTRRIARKRGWDAATLLEHLDR